MGLIPCILHEKKPRSILFHKITTAIEVMPLPEKCDRIGIALGDESSYSILIQHPDAEDRLQCIAEAVYHIALSKILLTVYFMK